MVDDIEVWTGRGEPGWSPPDGLTADDRAWLAEQMHLAGAQRDTTLEVVARGTRLIAATGVRLGGLVGPSWLTR